MSVQASAPPAKLSPEQRTLYDDMKKGIETNFQGFKAMDKDGTLIALIGPWNPWLKFAKIGAPVLAAYQGAIVVTEAAETCARDRDPCHRCALPCRL